ncbi:MAG: alkyl hydroperoxide reductase subunit F, partial [Ottowia sp.]|nr:alkyl hydroperoxide reductase subunit F [Ottowia sp.]
SAREAEKLAGVAPFDVLVVGSGPAGCTAAIYAARKGVRTGLIAERFGGQVNDTMDIANYPGVPEMTGPGYAAQLENHVRQYDVQVMAAQRVAKVTPAGQEGGYISVELENGARLQTRTLIAATGARWRNVNVPGEQEYKTKGVAYCPHCDGPLFKGKDVAVIGGGNSGVEAAIDLAGVVRHVHVLEFLPEMKADAVLQQKLRSLPNVDIHLNVQTTAIDGDGQRVSGLQYKEREGGAEKQIALQGVFVQIGLVPNTEWLDGVVERNRMGEIVVDARCASNVAGIFAAGDCSSVPYKQIVISAGEGAKAALSAFDYLIRTPAPQA